MTNLLAVSSLALGMGLYIIGQLPVDMPGDIKGWSSLGSIGVFGFLFYLMILHVIPGISRSNEKNVERVADTMQKMNDGNQAMLNRIGEQYDNGSAELSKALKNLTTQCAVTHAQVNSKSRNGSVD